MDYTLRIVSLGAGLLGALAGGIGTFAMLRRQSLLGDAIAHAALPGIGLAFLLTGTRAPLLLLLGAAIAGWLGTLLVLGITRSSRLPEDAALGIVLSAFFGGGLVVLTYVQRLPNAAQAGLETFLFGQAATLLARDVVVISLVALLVLLVVGFGWKEFKLLTFDRDYAQTLGLPVLRIEVLLTTLLVLAIVVGLQTAGVVLMSALVVAPAAAARQWTDSLGRLVLLAALLGGGAGVTGTWISALGGGIPTGPTIVLVASMAVFASLLFAPRRGIVAGGIRRIRARRQIRADAVLADLYALAVQHAGRPGYPHRVEVLRAMQGVRRGALRRSLEVLRDSAWAEEVGPGEWTLTTSGLERAQGLFPARAGEEVEAEV